MLVISAASRIEDYREIDRRRVDSAGALRCGGRTYGAVSWSYRNMRSWIKELEIEKEIEFFCSSLLCYILEDQQAND